MEMTPSCEKLAGDPTGACVRRISIQHRFVCQIPDDIKTVEVVSMRTHYK
jgi:Txe/YoeB family toxin of Txe-Axe toxin-antitoxin module